MERCIYNVGGPILGFVLKNGSSVSADIEDLRKTLKTVKEIHEEAEVFIYKNDIYGILALVPKIVEFENYF